MHTVLNDTASLTTKDYKNWLTNVEDMTSQSNVVFVTRTA